MAQDLNHSMRREPGWIARDDRTPTLFEGSALREDGTTVPVTMSDVSRDGCRLDFEGETLRIGEWVNLEAEGHGAMRGQVRWSLLGSAGVRFAQT
jgi:hypothetical protein